MAEFLCQRKLRVTPADAGAHPIVATQMDARVPAFARMTAGMTRWARLLQQARPSIENTVEMYSLRLLRKDARMASPGPKATSI